MPNRRPTRSAGDFRILRSKDSAARALFTKATGTGVLLLVFFLPLVVAVPRKGSARSERPRNNHSGQATASSSFAIEDFDGDHHPDIADVQTAQTSVANSSYLVQVRLSANGQRSLQVQAPSGGLLIEARDVNGDDAVDLVLTTAF